MGYAINYKRVLELSRIIRSAGEIIDLLEENDPQYTAIRRIIDKHGCSYAALAAIANALVSYQLSTRGEIYWTRFAEHIAGESLTSIRDLYSVHRGFLALTPYNRIGLEYKIRRLHIFYNSILSSQLYHEPLAYCGMLDKLVSILARIYRVNVESKTIVFAGKMYYYVCKGCGVEDVAGNIPIPVDRRIAYVTITSCLVADKCIEPRRCSYNLMKPRNRHLVVEAWDRISRETGIPCYRLDSLIWLIGRFIKYRDHGRIMREITRAYPFLQKHYDKLSMIVDEFTMCM